MSDRASRGTDIDVETDINAPAIGGRGPGTPVATPNDAVEGIGQRGTGTVTGGVTGGTHGVPAELAGELERIGDDQDASPGAVGANTDDTGK
jgi:hypothetical protein